LDRVRESEDHWKNSPGIYRGPADPVRSRAGLTWSIDPVRVEAGRGRCRWRSGAQSASTALPNGLAGAAGQ